MEPEIHYNQGNIFQGIQTRDNFRHTSTASPRATDVFGNTGVRPIHRNLINHEERGFKFAKGSVDRFQPQSQGSYVSASP
jgi:hypothetical protein